MTITLIVILGKEIVGYLLLYSVFGIVLESRQINTGMDTLTRFYYHLLMVGDSDGLGVTLWIGVAGFYTSTDGERFSGLEDSIDTFFNGEAGRSGESSGNSVGSGNSLLERTFQSEVLSDITAETVSVVTVSSIEGTSSRGQVRPHRGRGR